MLQWIKIKLPWYKTFEISVQETVNEAVLFWYTSKFNRKKYEEHLTVKIETTKFSSASWKQISFVLRILSTMSSDGNIVPVLIRNQLCTNPLDYVLNMEDPGAPAAPIRSSRRRINCDICIETKCKIFLVCILTFSAIGLSLLMAAIIEFL